MIKYNRRNLALSVLALWASVMCSAALAGQPQQTATMCAMLRHTVDAPASATRLLQAKPFAGSRLLSFPDDRMRVATLDVHPRAQALVWGPQDQQPIVLATVSLALAGNAPSKVILYLPRIFVDARTQAQMTLSSIEHLYSLMLLQERTRRFDLVVGRARAGARPLHAGDVLASLSRLRDCAAVALDASDGTKVVPWDAATVTPGRFQGAQQLGVSAVVRDTKGHAVTGADVSFERGEHLSCMACTDAKGVAACTLFDAHGHDHHDEGRKPTLINFSGRLSNGRIFPPTTRIAP